ncbi:MAG TPA: alpha/beta fold hydrolase [Bryobacteraceae bacterium]|jgi:pimeloyl-ACP methyl ester carboxylesterase|nr:alpha/beta fold hydrolase [Bryobacteraceae bacterium]
MVRFAFLLLAPLAAQAAACISASPGCTEWITFRSGPARSLVYRTYSLEAKNANITRALIMVHGAGRDADNYFRTATAAAFLGSALDDTVVIAPRFASNDGRGCRDTLAANEVNWSCNGDSWRSGGTSTSNDDLTSFDFADELLRKLARKDAFPNLRIIVIAGHSAGGQFVTRYEMANKVHDTLGVPVKYVVSNPSSYAYLDATRPSEDGAQFRAFRDARNCTTYNHWPYGLEGRTGYTAKIPDDQLKKQLVSRPVDYLLGEIDILPLGGFDSSCPAMAQGPTRLARGEAFVKYVDQKFGGNQKATVVPLCGHNARCMFTSEVALPIIFPKD